jgi:hypothetical protein
LEIEWARMPKDAETDADFAAYEAKHRDTIAKLREATKRPGLGALIVLDGKDEDQLLATGMRLHYMTISQNACIVLLSQARRAAADGDFDTAMADVIAVLKLARQFQEQPFLVSGLQTMTYANMAYEAINQLVRDYGAELTATQLRDLAHAVASVELDWSWWIKSERLLSRDMMQRLFTDDGRGDGHFIGKGLELLGDIVNGDLSRNCALAAISPVAIASRREMTDFFERYFDEVIARGDQPVWEWQSPEPDDLWMRWSKFQQYKYFPLVMILPSTSGARRRIEQCRGLQGGVLVGLALEVYRREHGAWPESLDALSPQYLPRVPVDRMTGKPLRYVVRDDRPVVYSVGADLDDDGGRWPAGRSAEWDASPGGIWEGSQRVDGDWVLWGGEEKVDEEGSPEANSLSL